MPREGHKQELTEDLLQLSPFFSVHRQLALTLPASPRQVEPANCTNNVPSLLANVALTGTAASLNVLGRSLTDVTDGVMW